MKVSRPKLQASWWRESKPTGVKDKKLDDALDAFERARKVHERKQTSESAAELKRAADAISKAAVKATSQCDRKTDREIISALKDLVKLAQREEKSVEEVGEGAGEKEGKHTSPVKVRMLMKKLRDERMAFAFGLSSRTAMWFALDRKMKGNALMNQLKKESACKKATFGEASGEDKQLVLEVEGPSLPGLDKLVKEYLKQNKPMPFTQVSLSSPSEAVDDAVADALDEDDADADAEAGVETQAEAQAQAEAAAAAAQDAARQIKISASVGAGGRNQSEDVLAVQQALNRHGATLDADGKSGPKTIGAIRKFQQGVGFNSPDGRVDPGGKTEAALNGKSIDVGPGGGGGAGGGAGAGGAGGGAAGGAGGGGAGAAGGRAAGRAGVEDAFDTAEDFAKKAVDQAKKVARKVNEERKRAQKQVEDTVEWLLEKEREAQKNQQREAERLAREARKRVESAYEEGKKKVGEFAKSAEDLARDGTEAAKDAFDEATRLAGEGIKTTRDTAEEAADWLKDQWDNL